MPWKPAGSYKLHVLMAWGFEVGKVPGLQETSFSESFRSAESDV